MSAVENLKIPCGVKHQYSTCIVYGVTYQNLWYEKSILALEPKFHGVGAKEKSPKKSNNGHKTRFFFSKRANDFELLKQVPESSHQSGSFSVSQ